MNLPFCALGDAWAGAGTTTRPRHWHGGRCLPRRLVHRLPTCCPAFAVGAVWIGGAQVEEDQHDAINQIPVVTGTYNPTR